MILGIDVSSFLEEQRIINPKYKENGKVIDPFLLFKNQGISHVRIRIWNDPYSENHEPYLGGTCDLDNCLNLIKQLEKYGFSYLIDFHYSDFWVDPSKQSMPKAWVNLKEEELLKEVYTFTKDCLTKIKEVTDRVTHIQIGNETTHGMLFPYAKLEGEGDRKESFAKLSNVLRHGIKAANEVFPEAKTIIHLEQSYDQKLYLEYFEELIKNNVKFDIIGSTYYPFWHHSFLEYFANMDLMRNHFHKEVMNMETAFPFTLKDYQDDGDHINHLVINENNASEMQKVVPYEISKKGQQEYVHDFLKSADEHQLSGVFYWEPLWIPGKGICWASIEGQKYQNDIKNSTRNEWANQCLFDYQGEMLPAFKEFKKN